MSDSDEEEEARLRVKFRACGCNSLEEVVSEARLLRESDVISEEDEAGSAGAAELCKTVELVTAGVAEACNRVVTPMVYDDKIWYGDQS